MPKRNGQGIDLLADPTRRGIVALIALGVFQPSKIAREMGLSRPATSRQLRILVRAKLVMARRDMIDGRRRNYYLEWRKHGQITAWLAGTEVGRPFPPARPATDPTFGIFPLEAIEAEAQALREAAQLGGQSDE
jgi:DNA-binding transcriptional ArsR family regulator